LILDKNGQVKVLNWKLFQILFKKNRLN
jgi:hypothetical protein